MTTVLTMVVIVVRNSTFLFSELRKQWRSELHILPGTSPPQHCNCVYLASLCVFFMSYVPEIKLYYYYYYYYYYY